MLSILRAVSKIAPHARVYRLHNETFSRDPAVVDELNRDPLIFEESEPARTASAMLDARDRLSREFSHITLPVFILHGTLDKTTKPSGSEKFYESAGSPDKTLKLYPGHFHDLLADVDKQVVMDDIQQWIDRHMPRSLSAPARA